MNTGGSEQLNVSKNNSLLKTCLLDKLSHQRTSSWQ